MWYHYKASDYGGPVLCTICWHGVFRSECNPEATFWQLACHFWHSGSCRSVYPKTILATRTESAKVLQNINALYCLLTSFFKDIDDAIEFKPFDHFKKWILSQSGRYDAYSLFGQSKHNNCHLPFKITSLTNKFPLGMSAFHITFVSDVVLFRTTSLRRVLNFRKISCLFLRALFAMRIMSSVKCE